MEYIETGLSNILNRSCNLSEGDGYFMALINKQTFDICNYNNCSDYDENDYFEVDEYIALAIAELNKKGYTTAFCCCGHIFNDLTELTMYPGSSGTINGVFMEVPVNSEPKVFDFTQSNEECYIVFASSYHFPLLPDGFEYKEDEFKRTYIEKDYSSKDGTLERGFEILKTMSELYDWTLSLESIRQC